MALSPDSPLRRLPVSLAPRQALLLDGIRLAAQMAAIAHQRLVEGATRAGEQRDEGAGLIPVLFADAWALVDHINRLRLLIAQLPNWRQNTALAAFYEATRGIRDLRDTVQHLHKRLDGMVSSRQPIMGTLTWFFVPDASVDTVMMIYAVPGAAHDLTSIGWDIVPLLSSIQHRVDHIVLSTWQPSKRAAGTRRAEHIEPQQGGVTPVSLTASMDSVTEVIDSLEALLRPQFEGHDTRAADVVLALVFGPVRRNTVTRAREGTSKLR